jgi:hypothetical protein
MREIFFFFDHVVEHQPQAEPAVSASVRCCGFRAASQWRGEGSPKRAKLHRDRRARLTRKSTKIHNPPSH